MAGGMWSVALTDFFQAVVIIVGWRYVAWVVADAGGRARACSQAAAAVDRMRFLPEPDARPVLAWITAALFVVLGSVPQQDVLQRVMSAQERSDRGARVDPRRLRLFRRSHAARSFLVRGGAR